MEIAIKFCKQDFDLSLMAPSIATNEKKIVHVPTYK